MPVRIGQPAVAVLPDTAIRSAPTIRRTTATAANICFLCLSAGYLADAFDRRRLMIVSLLLANATSLGLAAFSYFHGSISMMYALLFMDSCALRLGWPASKAVRASPRQVSRPARNLLIPLAGMPGVACPLLSL